jgi:hypothetical protein
MKRYNSTEKVLMACAASKGTLSALTAQSDAAAADKKAKRGKKCPGIFRDATSDENFLTEKSSNQEQYYLPFNASRRYCNFCGDAAFAEDGVDCVECGARMCRQVIMHGRGCIGWATPKDGDFRCVTCFRNSRVRQLDAAGVLEPVTHPVSRISHFMCPSLLIAS